MRKNTAFTLAVILCCLAALGALGAGVTLTLRAEEPVAQQATALFEYIDKLDQADQQQWHRALEGRLQAGAAPLRLYEEPSVDAGYVYMVSSGKVYHLQRDCSTLSRSKNVQEVTLEQAVAKGRRPCKVCGGT